MTKGGPSHVICDQHGNDQEQSWQSSLKREEGCQGLVLRKAWLVARDSSVEGGLVELFVVDEKVVVMPFVLMM